MKTKILPILLFLLYTTFVFAQDTTSVNRIILDMNPYANLNYVLLQHKGNEVDTIARGKLDSEGVDTLQISVDIRRGAATISVANTHKMLILLGEDNFKVINNGVGIGFKNSANNQILVDYFTARKADIDNDSSYATKYIIIDQFIKRLETLIPYDNVMIKDAMMDYIEEELDIEALYLSGRWKEVFQKIHILYAHPNEYAKAMIKVAQRTKSQTSFEFLSEFLMSIYQSAWSAREIYANYLMNSGRTFSASSPIPDALRMYKLKIGEPAPKIFGKSMTSSVVIFHETGNDKSKEELELLKSMYRQLRIRGYEIVSVSADVDRDVFANASQSLPWINKLCDYEGYNGKEFIEYGITIIPTIYIIDKLGNIKGRYATMLGIKY